MLLLIIVSVYSFLHIRLRTDALLKQTHKMSFEAQNYLPPQAVLNR